MQVSVAEIHARSRAALLAHGAGALAGGGRGPRRRAGRGNRQRDLRALLPRILLRAASERSGGRHRGARAVPRPRRAACVSTRGSASPNPPLPAPAGGAGGGAGKRGGDAFGGAFPHLHLAGVLHRTDRGGGADRAGHDQRLGHRGGAGRATPVLGTNPFAITIPGAGRPGAACRFLDLRRGAWPDHHGQGRGGGDPRRLGGGCRRRPTTDPEAALSGALQSAAGPKGWALGLMVEAFAAGLTGSVNSLRREGAQGRRGARPTIWASSTS
jgi:(2R)-3-sulfolactate dehydrogenase (NADP+)